MVTTISQQAFAYHVKGYNVLPVGADKRPAISSWKQWQTEQQSPDLVMEWFSDDTKQNVAIITGKISGITVVDIDTKGGQPQADAMRARFPLTRTIKTPSGGYHLYYKYAEGFTVSANAYPDLPNVDIRSDSGYVVAPPSHTDKGEYEVIVDMEPIDFPAHLFPKKKPRKTLTEMTTASRGNRDDTLTSFAGKLLQATNEGEWYTEVLPAVERANKTYTPPLSDADVRKVFNSIVKKEKDRRANLILSPIQIDGRKVGDMKIRKNGNGQAYKDMANVVAVLEAHPFYKDTIRYNEFRQEIEYNGKTMEDADIVKIQYFMQVETGLQGISKEAVYSAIVHYAQKNKYDEAIDWLKSLKWDGVPRLNEWLHTATNVENNAYHRGIGAQWFMGMVRRIMLPGCVFDYMLVLTGDQGLGKTSLFRIIGGPFYKSYTGAIDNKDFYLALRGAIIIDLDEGATLYRSEAIKIKSVITDTHDEFRAPYDRIMKKYPRRFVFSMSTNDTEPFRDITGNRRYWAIDIKQGVNFKWLEENRDQLFAETYHYFITNTPIPEVPYEEALAIQEAHLPDDTWTDMVAQEVKKDWLYVTGSPEFSTTILDVYSKVFPDENLARLGRAQEMRVASIFKKELGLEKIQKMIDGERKMRWYITKKKQKELQAKPQKQVIPELDQLVNELKDKPLGF